MTTANLEKGMQFQKFIPFMKVDEATHTVWGLVTSEAMDKDGERCHYKTTKPLYQEWCMEAADESSGKTIGDMWSMHTKRATGRFIKVLFDDVNQQIWMAGEVVDANEWEKCQKGVLRGFSQGGKYENVWLEKGERWYTARPKEVSLVDKPANPDAKFTTARTFKYVKTDGTSELRKFALADVEEHLEKDAKTKRVAGKDLSASDFAYVGDPEKTATWKLPIMDAAHVRNALARFNQTQGIPEGEKSKVLGRIKAKAKGFGIDVSDDAAKLAKSMWSIGSLADAICSLDYVAESLEWEAEFEGDKSPVPAKLYSIIDELCGILVQVAEEETAELTAEKSAKENAMTAEEKAKLDLLEKENTDLKDKLAKAAPPAAAAPKEGFVKIGTTTDGVDIFKKAEAAAPAADLKDEKIAKLEGEVAELNKGFETLHEGLQKILAVPGKPAIVANPAAKEALGKSSDNGGGDPPADFEKMSTVDQIKFQQTRSRPELPFHSA